MTSLISSETADNSVLIERRRFLRLGLTAAAGVAVGAATLLQTEEAQAAENLRRSEIIMASFGGGPRTLSFKNTHTGEELTTTYWRSGSYEQAGLDEINYILRDFRTGDVHAIDKSLLNTIAALRRQTGASSPISIISGYRSPRTNAALRRGSEGVARRSFHLQGKAIDIRIPGYSTSGIARQARRLAVGGVGYYNDSDFVHVDTGPVRTW
jgi:uncharacterized protein YcbK (DUF882 family)